MEFLEQKKSSTSIHLTEEGYASLQAHLISGVQAKATRSNKIKFGNVNIKNGKGGLQEQALQVLQDIYQDQKTGKSFSILKNEHEDYDALFNYNLAHYINHIVGKNNKLLLTRKGLTDTYSFIMEQFNYGRYFKGNRFRRQAV